ncbi:MAG: hypothetical protein H6Q33_1697 [Deltaproteobacteria bacterium]|nr:hypothetical protein [Deltaproteobacteria bacterium]
MGKKPSEAWDAFCEQLKRAGRVLDREGTPRDDLTQAEGYRKLVHLVRMGFDATVDFADPEHPPVYQLVTPTTLGEGETPDAHYHQAFIDGAATYRLTGRRGTAPFIELTVYAGKIGLQDVSRQVGALTEQELSVASDGTFEIVLSPQPHPGNWIRTEPDANLLYIRQYTHDWGKTQSATFELRKDGAAPHRPPLTLEQVRSGMERAAAYVDKSVHTWAAIVERRAAAGPNVFFEIPAAPDPSRPEMPIGHRFSSGYFRLAPGEALVVTFAPTEVPYWGLTVTNYWFEPLSYEDHRSHVNNRTAKYEADGSVRVIIADEHRMTPNWIDTLGHREGVMMFRWSRSKDPVPRLHAEVVSLATLSGDR